jgi:hypothetical protein
MLFNQTEFEQKIEESELKKGLGFFSNHKLELLSNLNSIDFYFLLKDKKPVEIHVKKKGDSIISYNCSCKTESYCRHLAATLFYFQEELLLFLKREKKPKSGNNALNLKADFYGDKKLFEHELFSKYESIIEHEAYAYYSLLIKSIIKPYLNQIILQESQAADIYHKILVVFPKTKRNKIYNIDFYIYLAILIEISQVLNIIKNNATYPFFNLIKTCKKKLEQYVYKGLSNLEIKAWLQTSIQSVKNVTYFNSEIYPFLISYATTLINNTNDLSQLQLHIKKRKESNRFADIKRKVVAEIQLNVLENEFTGKNFDQRNYDNTAELPVALAEIQFCRKKHVAGFKLLQDHANKLKRKNINIYLNLIEFIIEKAHKLNFKKIEENYLREYFIFGYHVSLPMINRYFEININSNKNEVTTELIDKIKSDSPHYTFDKLSVILSHQNRLDDLINEIKREKNKFSILNQIAIKKLPYLSSSFTDLYVKQFISAIGDAKFPYFQKQVFNLANSFISQLHPEYKKEIIEAIKEKLLHEKYLLNYVLEFYP